MSKKIIYILLISLAVSITAYFYVKAKNDKKNKLSGVPYTEPGVIKKSTTPPAKSGVIPVVEMGVAKFPLKFGSRGKAVQFMQVIVGVAPDGVWGNGTDIAMQKLFKVAKNTGNEISLPDFISYSLIGSGSVVWPLQIGSTGNYVKALQIMLNQKIDGKFGASTAAACIKIIGAPRCSRADFETLLTHTINAS